MAKRDINRRRRPAPRAVARGIEILETMPLPWKTVDSRHPSRRRASQYHRAKIGPRYHPGGGIFSFNPAPFVIASTNGASGSLTYTANVTTGACLSPPVSDIRFWPLTEAARAKARKPGHSNREKPTKSCLATIARQFQPAKQREGARRNAKSRR